FKITTSGTFTLLHSFAGTEGSNVVAPLVQGNDGFFYGTASTGGTPGMGTAYRMANDGTLVVLHAFAGGSVDGAMPQAPLMQAMDGNLYGTTQAGGSSNRGTIFSMMTSGGAVTLLHAFTGGPDGSFPTAGLIQADGIFYGSTQLGTIFTRGTLFQMM